MKKVLKLSSILFVVAFLFTLVSCAPKNAEAATAKLEKKDYTVMNQALTIQELKEKFGIDGVKNALFCFKKDKDGSMYSLTAVLFEKKSQAKDAASKIKESNEKANLEINITIVGKWVIYGSEQAIEDFKN